MAHILANDALLIDSTVYDLDVIPVCIQVFIQLDFV